MKKNTEYSEVFVFSK